MKKILNGSFFGICFLASLLAEAYLIHADTGNLFSAAGIGIVVLITGYLLMDAIRSGIDKRFEDAKFYLDRIYQEETEKSSERFTEESNIHKATYTAIKKNSTVLSQQSEELQERLEALENNLTRAFTAITELQKKAMEGQRNALNFEINYNKENTKQLIHAIREEDNQSEVKELLTKLVDSMEKNNELLEKQLASIRSMPVAVPSGETDNKSMTASDVVEIDWNDVAEQEAGSLTATEWDGDTEEPVVDNLTETGWDVDAELMLGNITDGWEDSIVEAPLSNTELVGEEDSYMEEAVAAIEETSTEEKADSWSDIGMELNELIGSWDTEENAPEAEAPTEAEPEPEAVQVAEEVIYSSEAEIPEPVKPSVTPLYSDPNKNLSADEIAKLFASFGQ